MKAAIVTGPGKTPIYGDFNEPAPKADEEFIQVTASALSQLTKGRASGAHYSSSGQFPAIAGVDGVGRTADGRRVYFALPDPPFGAMAEKAVVRKGHCIPLPEGVDDVTAAAIANPGMSSWAALKERAHLAAGENVLINGATGVAGRLALQIARHMGAKKVIATGRDAQALEELKGLGADVIVPLTLSPEDLQAAFQEQFAGDGVHVVLDYLWGKSAEMLIVEAAKADKDGVQVRYVNIGSMSGGEISLPAAALRSSDLMLMGSGIGSVPLAGLLGAIQGVMQAVVPGKLQIETRAVPLADVEENWNKDSGRSRVVFVVG
ncbi:MAG TPA: zinc-binding alcohol dehydrogenase family protein [Acidobacteriaceae bacterium]|jgi:NADPH:quinone reductase-like Zn-dependent oxidoreductase|nr:zinc-binding alcohol dehydrogenase family protein [Acidobacteriaceae bacterium]